MDKSILLTMTLFDVKLGPEYPPFRNFRPELAEFDESALIVLFEIIGSLRG